MASGRARVARAALRCGSLACCATGLGRRDESDELQRLVPRGFVRSALAILVVNSLFDLVG